MMFASLVKVLAAKVLLPPAHAAQQVSALRLPSAQRNRTFQHRGSLLNKMTQGVSYVSASCTPQQ